MLHRKLLTRSLVVVTSVLILVIISRYFLLMDKPVFMENNLELYPASFSNGIESNQQQQKYTYKFDFQYLTNKTDLREITGIEFNRHADLQASAVTHPLYELDPAKTITSGFDSIEYRYSSAVYGRYRFRTVSVTIEYSPTAEMEKVVPLSTAAVTFNDGSVYDTNLGTILLYPPDFSVSCLVNSSNTPLYKGTTSIYHSRENIVLEEASSHMLADLNGLVELQINGVDYREISGLSVNANEVLQVNILFNRTGESKYNQNQILPVLTYRDETGNVYKTTLHELEYLLHARGPHSVPGIVKYIRSREE